MPQAPAAPARPAAPAIPPGAVAMEPGEWSPVIARETGPEFLETAYGRMTLGGERFDVAREAPVVEFARFPDLVNRFNEHPRNWSLWGQGCLAPDGCHYTSLGDHSGQNGEVFLYQYEPRTRAVRRVFSFQKLMGHQPGDWGFGKVHGRLDADADGWLYFAGYWGEMPDPSGVEGRISELIGHRRPEIAALLRNSPPVKSGQPWPGLSARYPGGALARYNVLTHVAESLGVPVPGFSWPMHAADFGRGLLYLLGTDNSFACFDLAKRELRCHGEHDLQYGMRGLLVDTEEGAAYFNADVEPGPRLARYDAATNRVTLTRAVLPLAPGSTSDENDYPRGMRVPGRIVSPRKRALRAATARRAADGCFYAMTAHCDGPRLFRFDPRKEEIEDLGFNYARGYYTTAIALSPGGRYLYYLPDAHGTAYRSAAPLVQYDIQQRRRKVLAFLDPVMNERHGYRIGGTFSLSVSPDGGTLYLPVNGNIVGRSVSHNDREEYFGAPLLLVIQVPESERRE